MAPLESTCWTVIHGAAAGNPKDREQFARWYGPVVRAYLAARWRTSSCQGQLDDAVQEVFVECFRRGGALDRVEPGRGGGFRPFLYGVVRNVALRFEALQAREQQHQPPAGFEPAEVPASEDSLERFFDRAWARALLREAAQRQREQARQTGEPAERRVELLHLRFYEGLPIREIARRWQLDAAVLHREYARARQEFRAALLEVMAFHHPGSPAELEQACAELFGLLA